MTKKIERKTTQLKNMLTGKSLSFLMEAHSGISAKIVEEAGFNGIWGSGLSLSAAMGVRDNNEASWTQVLEAVEFMSDATTIPILLDGDTGYGNFNNMRRLVHKLEQRGIAGVCIEDKIFPKTNSFLRGEKQPLADIEEFSGKIKAGLDARSDDDFCVVARVEAFIAGWGLEEALLRAESYRKAGATAILMHSKKSTAEDIALFMSEWGDRCPVVIVPTKYYSTPTSDFEKMGISTVIWANHLMRSSITSMQNTAAQIFKDVSLVNVEDKIAPVKEIFRLQNDQELADAEKLYFNSGNNSKAIILAASRGSELGELTLEKPKALLEVNNESILKQSIDKIRRNGANDITVVRGYKKDVFPDYGCTYIDNENFEATSELGSLLCAASSIEGDLIIGYGDICYRGYVLNLLNESPFDITIVVDSHTQKRAEAYVGDFVSCSVEDTRNFTMSDSFLVSSKLCSKESFSDQIHGEWIGLVGCKAQGSQKLKEGLYRLSEQSEFNNMKMSDLFTDLLQNDVRIGVAYIEGHWLDIDSLNDFESAQGF